MINLDKFSKDCQKIKEQSPLVLNITNYVAMNIAANSLLAIGASPIMSSFDEEMEDLSNICNAAVINIGTLDRPQIETYKLAAKCFSAKGKPWVLDPVGVGASKIRTQSSLELIEYGPSVIRANASEIAVLSGSKIQSKGVDSQHNSEDILEAAKELALKTGAVVSMSGAIDYITDGVRVESVNFGSSLMPRVTAMGCTASALTGAFVSVNPSAFESAAHAMLLMGLCGEKAAKDYIGLGTFATRFIDCLSDDIDIHRHYEPAK